MLSRRRRSVNELLIFVALFVGFAVLLWIIFQTKPAALTDFSK